MPKFSQVFLKDEKICQRIAQSVFSFKKEEFLVEIGPGLGALTKFLFEKQKDMLAVEIDKDLVPALKSGFPQLNVINSDFLKLKRDSFPCGPVFFCGNLPYKISTAIIEKIMDFDDFSGAVFMFQKEVAQKLCAKPKDDEYGYISAVCGFQMKISRLFDVHRSLFFPVPKVDSTVIVLEPKKMSFSRSEILAYRKAVSFSFMHRRKTILNSIFLCFSGKVSKENISAALNNVQIPPGERAENIDFDRFFALSKVLPFIGV